MKNLCDTDEKSSKADQEHAVSKMDRDEGDVQKIMATMEEMQTPFNLDSISEELINMASEKVAKEL